MMSFLSTISSCRLLSVFLILRWLILTTITIETTRFVVVDAFTTPLHHNALNRATTTTPLRFSIHSDNGNEATITTTKHQRLKNNYGYQHQVSNVVVPSKARRSNLFLSTSSDLEQPRSLNNDLFTPSLRRLKKMMIELVTTLLLTSKNFYMKIFHPNALIKGDEESDDVLPTAASSCPLLGNQVLVGSRTFGTGYFWHQMSFKLGHPRMWIYSFLGSSGLVMSGGKRIKDFLSREFKSGNVGGIQNSVQASGILSEHNLLAEKDKKKHSALRRLIGAAMTPSVVAASMPALQIAAEKQINKLLLNNDNNNNEVVKMETVCNDYTLDVAWKQILGLNLSENDIPAFTDAVDTWISGFTSLRLNLNIAPKGAPAFVAKRYLENLITHKIEHLEQNGPDGSTLSGMVFARDDSEGEEDRKLTREEVIENCLLLILAGSETSASTLTNAMLFLGLSPDKWTKLVEEQQRLVNKYSDAVGEELQLTTQMLNHDCPYLDGVIREAMRIKPISSGAPRIPKSTLSVDGNQIPKGWNVMWSVLLTHELDPTTYKEDGSHMDIMKGFQPERWLEDATRPTTDFIPMGAGPRYCLGSALAYAEMKVFVAILAQTVRKFELLPENFKKNTNEVEWKRMSIIPKPLRGVPITISSSQKMMPTTMTTEGQNNNIRDENTAVVKEDEILTAVMNYQNLSQEKNITTMVTL